MANKYIQQYNTQADYDSGTHSYPNVSLIASTDEVLYTTLEEFWAKIMSGATIGVMYTGGTVWTGSNTSITEYTIPNKQTSMEVRMTDAVTNIGAFAFSNCSGLTSITISSGVTSIGANAFQNCSGLTSASIPNSVTSINNNVFIECKSLTSITIPSSVTSIGYGILKNSTSLTFIKIESTTPPSLGKRSGYANTDAFDNTNNCPIYVPSESVNAYKTATNWSYYANRIQAIPSA